jgi:ribose transport system permease protein
LGRFRNVDIASRFGLVIGTLALFGAFSLAIPDTFPTSQNINAILGTQAILGLLALAVMVPLIAGEFDLSLGALMGFSALLVIHLLEKGVPPVAAILICLCVGFAVGLVNAFFVVIVGLTSFIATLGSSTILGGLALYVSGGKVLFEGIPASFLEIGQSTVFGVPIVFVYLVGLTILLWYLLEHTPFGRLLTAVGFSKPAARLAGLRIRLLTTSSFVVAGTIAALAGVLQASQFATASPTGGPDALLPAFAGAFLGATTVRRGQFNAWGTLVGIYFLAIGIAGLQQAGAPFWVSPVFNGTALLVAVSATYLVGRQRRAAAA